MGNFFSNHRLDERGNAAGGVTSGQGFIILWQAEGKAENGVQVAVMIDVVVDRLLFLNAIKKNEDTEKAIEMLEKARGFV